MKLATVKEIRELSKEVTLEDGTKQTVYPGELTGYLVNGSIHVPIDINNRLYKKIQKSSIEIEPAYSYEELLQKVKALLISKTKTTRDSKVKAIVVKLSSGVSLDADEKSQERISRATSRMLETDIIKWIDADNNVVTLKKQDLQEALKLAGEAQEYIYVTYAALRDKINNCSSIQELQEMENDV